jgi:hypothetical protein
VQIITAPPLISTIHKSPQHPLSLFQPSVFSSRSLAMTCNSGDSASRAWVPSSQPPVQNSTELLNESASYVTTDGQSASLSWNNAPSWGLRPDFYYCQTVAILLMLVALCDERTGLSFTISAGPRQRSHSWVRVQWDSRPYFTVSDSRLPFSWPLLLQSNCCIIKNLLPSNGNVFNE